MRFTRGFAALFILDLVILLAGSAVAQGDFAPDSCPGGMNLELTALTLPQPVVAPVPSAPSAPPPPPPKKQAPPKPQKPPKTPKKKAPRPVPQQPAPAAEEPPYEPPPQRVYPQRNRTDDALNDMIGTFGSRPRSEPVIDYTAPLSPNQGMGEGLRQGAAVLDRVNRRRHRDRERRPRERPTREPQSTPQSTPQHTDDAPVHREPVTSPMIERDSFDVR